MSKRKSGRNVHGIILLDKRLGVSSNRALQEVRRLFNANKAGHTGSLDPLATGLLPICLGEATKVSSYLLDADKRYQVTCQLGILTDSGDSDGNVIETKPVAEFSQQQLATLVKQFVGEQQQVPPMYSALKHQGQPLYKLARQGIEVERKSRQITIYDIQILACTTDTFTLDVTCSKGTYIRTLVEDISQALGCGGHVTMLRRIEVAGYQEAQSISIEQLDSLAQQEGIAALDKCLLPTEDALPDWPAIDVSDEMVTALRYGQAVQVEHAFERANVRLFDQEKAFLGLGEMSETGLVAPKRVFVSAAEQ